ncbi:MAG: hypothetical protein ACJ75J_09825 [Cytophagaceae bacterium]|jgi:hypothetical protein
MICNKCKHPSEGKDEYCSCCGHKLKPDRFTVKYMTVDWVKSTLDDQKSLPHTMWRLTRRPGDAIREYIEGERLSLYEHDKYLLLIGAFITFLSLKYKFFSNKLTDTDSESNVELLKFFSLENQKTFFNDFFSYAEQYATILNIIAIPVFALASFMVFSRRPYNLGENLVLNIYITAQQLFYLILLVPFLELFPASHPFLIPAYTILTMAYNIWVYMEFFDTVNFKGFFKSSLVVLICYVAQFILNVTIFWLFRPFLMTLQQWQIL